MAGRFLVSLVLLALQHAVGLAVSKPFLAHTLVSHAPLRSQKTYAPGVAPPTMIATQPGAPLVAEVAVEPAATVQPTPSSLTRAAGTVASVGSLVAADVALRKLFVARSIKFPSSLAGMLMLFSLLCSLQATVPRGAQAIFNGAKPACAFISKWLAAFFVPNLVLLPIVLRMGAADAVRLAMLVLAGAFTSLPVCASAAMLASKNLPSAAAKNGEEQPQSPPTASPVPQAAVSAKPAGARRPLQRLVDMVSSPAGQLGAISMVTGSVALGVQRLTSAGAAPFLSSLTLPLRGVHFLFCTLSAFELGKTLPTKVQKLLHPLITCSLLTLSSVASFAAAASLPFTPILRSYLVPGGGPLAGPGNLLLFMLGPATLSFAFQMFERRRLMRESAAAVGAVSAAASVYGLFGTAIAARALGLASALRLAALPRQVTAPLAIAISGMIGADPSLAATLVVVTGLIVANFGRAVLDAMKVEDPVSRGLAMGAAGHGIGTAAMSTEREAFPFAAIAMALNAALSTILVSLPPVRRALLAAAGISPVA